MSTLKVSIAVQRRQGNTSLTVFYEGKVIGTVLEDRPGVWLATPNPPPPPAPTYPTVEDAVLSLVERGEQVKGAPPSALGTGGKSPQATVQKARPPEVGTPNG